MLETGIPNVLWRTEKMNNKLYGELQDDEHKFMRDVDTNYNPSLNERQPSDKPFAFKKEGSDFGLSDKISSMKFTFQNANNNLLLNEQLPNEQKFRRSGGIGGINSDFDSRAPKTDYTYVDPQFYEYRLNGMSIEKFVANKRMQEGGVNPETLDPTSRAIYQRFEEPKIQQKKDIINKTANDITKNIMQKASLKAVGQKPIGNINDYPESPEGGGNIINSTSDWGVSPSTFNSPDNKPVKKKATNFERDGSLEIARAKRSKQDALDEKYNVLKTRTSERKKKNAFNEIKWHSLNSLEQPSYDSPEPEHIRFSERLRSASKSASEETRPVRTSKSSTKKPKNNNDFIGPKKAPPRETTVSPPQETTTTTAPPQPPSVTDIVNGVVQVFKTYTKGVFTQTHKITDVQAKYIAEKTGLNVVVGEKGSAVKQKLVNVKNEIEQKEKSSTKPPLSGKKATRSALKNITNSEKTPTARKLEFKTPTTVNLGDIRLGFESESSNKTKGSRKVYEESPLRLASLRSASKESTQKRLRNTGSNVMTKI